MGKLLSIFFATLLLPLLSNAQVSFSNNKPKFGETVSFIYDPSQSPLANLSTIRASAFFFSEKLAFTPPQTIFLKKIGQEWRLEIDLNSKGSSDDKEEIVKEISLLINTLLNESKKQ
jgi:hypothetical protein